MEVVLTHHTLDAVVWSAVLVTRRLVCDVRVCVCGGGVGGGGGSLRLVCGVGH